MGIENVKDIDKYNGFRKEAESSIRKIDKLKKQLVEVNTLIDNAYLKEAKIDKNLSASERSYQKLVLQIKEKELEIKAMELESIIEGTEDYLHQQILYLARMEGKILPLNFSYQIRDARMSKSINDNYANMNIVLEENELYTMQMRLLSMKVSRGDISEEERKTRQADLKESIISNDEYVEMVREELLSERKKQLEQQVSFKISQGQISVDMKDVILAAIHDMKEYSRSFTLDGMFMNSNNSGGNKVNPKR